jgi:hypothetical protein
MLVICRPLPESDGELQHAIPIACDLGEYSQNSLVNISPTTPAT